MLTLIRRIYSQEIAFYWKTDATGGYFEKTLGMLVQQWKHGKQKREIEEPLLCKNEINIYFDVDGMVKALLNSTDTCQED